MILDDIIRETRKRLILLKEKGYYDDVHRRVSHYIPKGGNSFYHNLSKPGLSFICELKKASPSEGVISKEFPFIQIAKEYESAGAAAISCLTEPHWFKGDIRYLEEVSGAVYIPVLRKDFIIDYCQIEEAAISGAAAILLIAAVLNEKEIESYIRFAKEFGLSVLAEAHNEREVEILLNAGADIIGINNRNLTDFSIDLGNTQRLSRLIPKDILLVSESGIHSEADIEKMKDAGVDAVLIGEMFMKSNERKCLLEQLIRRFG